MMKRFYMLPGKTLILFLLFTLSFVNSWRLPAEEAANGHLRVGVHPSFPPQYSLSESGDPQGFAIDIINALAPLAGFSIEFIGIESWSDMNAALDTGEIDIIPNQGITSGRLATRSFSDPVETFPIHIFFRESSESVDSLSGLSGKTVAVVESNVGAVLVQEVDNADVHVFLTAEDALFSLLSGNVDALIYPKPVLMMVARKIEIDDHLIHNETPLREIKRSISVRKGNEWIIDQFNLVIPDFIGSEAYSEIYVKWYGRPDPFWDITRVIVGMSILLGIIITVFLFWKYYSTEKIVRMRTKDLHLSGQLLEQVAEGIITVDPEGQIRMWNMGAAALFGYDRNEIIGSSAQLLFQEEGRAGALLESYTASGQISSDYQFVKKDGRVFWGLLSISVLKDERDAQLGFIIVVQDITERIRAVEAISSLEKRNQALLDHSPVGHIILDLDLTLKYISAGGVRMMNLPDADVVYGKPFPFGFFPSDYRQSLLQAIDRAMNSGETVTLELPGSDYYGEELWIHNTIQPVFKDDGSGVLEFLTLVIDDLTERRLVEQQLRQSEKMDAIGHLAGGVAHDFNNQLSGVLGYGDLLREQLKDPEMREYAERICTAAVRSSELTQKLLAFSRKGQYRMVPVSIEQLLKETSGILKRSIDKRIRITLDNGAYNSIVTGDPSQLQNAILNLAINARDSMPDGGGLIMQTENIDIHQSHPLSSFLSEGEYLETMIKDTGCGIPEEVLPHIFEPFYTTKEKGTGMGLSAVYGTIKQHHGAIFCESEVGEGTLFRFYMPLAESSFDTRETTPSVTYNGKKLHFLVVDDEEVVREFLADSLTHRGHSVESSVNGKTAVEFYSKNWKDIDIVILDMIMPEMNGVDTYRAMKQINPEVKAILASGYSMNTPVQEVLKEGVFDFIQKPFSTRELDTVIRKIL